MNADSSNQLADQDLPKDQSQFRKLADELSAVLARHGLRSKPYDDPSLPRFTVLPAAERQRILRVVDFLLQACLSMEAIGADLSRNRTLAWRVMNAMGFRPLSDVFDKVAETDVIEIYDSNSKIVFATPAFFDLTSYTMEDLYTRPWTDLWGRDPEITNQIFQYVVRTLSPENHDTVALTVPVHEVWELQSHEARRAFVQPTLFSPVKDAFGGRGFMSVNKFFGHNN